MTPPPPRSRLIADPALRGRRFCEAHTTLVDEWLVELFERAAPPSGMALVALGGHGRRELAPQSDLDLLLLVDRHVDPGAVPESMWYPIWDSGLKLGHSVRTVRDTLGLAADDLETATALLSARHLAGDAALSEELVERSRSNWRKRGKRWLPRLAASVAERHRSSGEVAFDLEPDLKEGRGGLRDVHALHWARDAGAEVSPDLLAGAEAAYEVLLAVRVELHRATSRPDDRLLMEEQDAIAPRLVASGDADDLMAGIAAAGRRIAWASDESWHDIRLTVDGGRRGRLRGGRPIEDGLVLRDGRVHLAGGTPGSNGAAAPADDPLLVLRVALAAARWTARVSGPLLEALGTAPAMPEPWPPEARQVFVELLSTGPAMVSVVEALDECGLWTRLLPEWEPARSRPQRNAFHRFTVDRHLLECAATAASLAPRTPRPDLLVVAALLHDIGKAYPGDHSAVGADLTAAIAARLGFDEDDADTLAFLTRHHLLLPDVATRRDLEDPATVAMVAKRVGTPERLSLLHALVEADGRATGPAAWGSWKAELVEQLASRVADHLRGAEPRPGGGPSFPSDAQRALMRGQVVEVRAEGDRLLVVCPDRRGVLSRVAGALALHDLDVVEANVHSERGMALEEIRVSAGGSGMITWERVGADVRSALQGRLALEARLAERLRGRRPTHPPGASQLPAGVRFDNDDVSGATVVEVVGPDVPGLLYGLTRALADMDLDVASARIQTVGGDAVDTFYVTGRDGGPVTDPEHQREVERALLHVLAPGS